MIWNALWLFVLSWAVRLGVRGLGGYSFFGVDENIYLRGAAKILNGTFNENYFMPGWFFILSHVMAWPLDPRIFVSIIASATVPFVYLIGEKLFDRRTGIIAGLLLAFYPEHIFYSHYVQAEVMMGLIITFGTWLIFRSSPLITPRRLMFGSLFFGAGLLFKHFTVISFAAMFLMVIFTRKKSVPLLVVCVALFLAPITAYTVGFAMRGGDPFLLLNSPLKSLREWDKNKALGYKLDKDERADAFSGQIKKVFSARFFPNAKRNLYNLWTPNSLVITRLALHLYKWADPPWSLIYLHVVYYTALMALGIIGLCLSPRSPFKIYASLNLFFLTLMSAVLFMVSRYRVPFMLFPILYAARFLAHPVNLMNIEPEHQNGRIAWMVALLLLIAAIYAERLPRLGSWY